MNEVLLNDLLDEIKESMIELYDFDLLSNTIKFSTVLYNGSDIIPSKAYLIVFKKVSAAYYINGTSERRFAFIEPDKDSHLELSEFEFYPEGIGNILITSNKYDWAKRYFADANFAIDMWNTTLFIEAGSITINGIEFIVK